MYRVSRDTEWGTRGGFAILLDVTWFANRHIKHRVILAFQLMRQSNQSVGLQDSG